MNLVGKKPKVTLIVPLYNHEKYVLKCLESILTQDYPDVELIVINDGSTDGSDKRVRDYLKEHVGSFIYISKENQGLVKTLNLGLTRASGDYFCELASDDLLLEGSLSKRAEFLDAHPDVDAVFGDSYIMEGETRTERRFYGGLKSGTGFRSSVHTIENLLTKKARYHVPTGMFRTSVLRGFGGFDEDFRYFEDIAIRYRFAMYAKIDFIDEPLIYYRIHRSNVSRSDNVPALREKVLALEKFSEELEPGSLKALVDKKLLKSYLTYSKKRKRRTVDRAEVAEALDRAVPLSPFSVKARLLRFALKFVM